MMIEKEYFPRGRSLLFGFLIALPVAYQPFSANAVTIGTNAEYLRGGIVEVGDPRSGPPPSTLVSEALVPGSRGASIDFSSDGNARAANFLGITAVGVDALFFSPDQDNPDQLDEVRAEATFSETVTNTGAGAEDFFYDFSIFAPNLKVADFAGAQAGALGAPTATYNIEIAVNGSALFTSSATLNGGVGGTALSTSGTDLGNGGVADLGNIFEVQFNDFADDLFLGNFAAGESFLFETLVEVSVSSFPFELGGAAFVGDPGDVNGVPGVSGVIRSSGRTDEVPEPSALAIMALGLAGFGYMRRRRRA